MSRSNPSTNTPNPCKRWFEWSGGKDGGHVIYYDKEKKENIKVELPFTFILLDELATVRGWHDPSDSGIYANEIRDTRQDTMVVKSYKGGELAVGVYGSIRDRVKAVGGHFQSSSYLAFKDGAALALGNIAVKGAALNAWVEFRNANRSEIYKQAVAIVDFKEGKKGSIIFRVPVFELRSVTPETDAAAVEIDKELQDYLKGYLARPRDEQVSQPPTVEAGIRPAPPTNVYDALAGEHASRPDPDDDLSAPF